MSEIIEVGKIISILCIVFVYMIVWNWVIDHKKDCNRNSYVEVIVSRAWILIHIIGVIIFFIWCWIR